MIKLIRYFNQLAPVWLFGLMWALVGIYTLAAIALVAAKLLL